MRTYLKGAVREALSRMDSMKNKIPGSANNIFLEPLSTMATLKIDEQIDTAKNLFKDLFDKGFEEKDLIIDFQSIVSDLSKYEILITALNRQNQDDLTINFIVKKICKEINYPLQSPIACCLSKAEDYYCIDTEFNLMTVPLLEAQFLLHLPDIYHELCHTLLDVKHNSKVLGLQQGLGQFQAIVRQHFTDRILKERRRKNSTNHENIYFNWIKYWIYWSIELFCDLFAVYTLGSAFAWSHFHLCVKYSTRPFDTPISGEDVTHPADNARMETLLIALDLIGEKAEADKIRKKWNEYLDVFGLVPNSYYSKAFPKNILEQCAIIALQSIKSIDCHIAGEKVNERSNVIGEMLNKAWDEFWKDPIGFSDWEKNKMLNLEQKALEMSNF